MITSNLEALKINLEEVRLLGHTWSCPASITIIVIIRVMLVKG